MNSRRRLTIGFNNFAHAVDHYVMLIFPTVVIGLEVVYGRPYGELLALGTASFAAFGIFSLPAGWLADRWSRRNMMAVFYIGCGAELSAAALAPNFITLALALFALGVFASIYHPVGTAIADRSRGNRGRTLAFNGVCGNIGVALAAGITATLTGALGWRGAFIVPAIVCVMSGILYLVHGRGRSPADRRTRSTPAVPLALRAAVMVFGAVHPDRRSPPVSSSTSSRWRCPRSSTSGSATTSTCSRSAGSPPRCSCAVLARSSRSAALVERIPAHILLPVVVADAGDRRRLGRLYQRRHAACRARRRDGGRSTGK